MVDKNIVVVDGDSLKYIAGCLVTRHSLFLKSGSVVSCNSEIELEALRDIQDSQGEIVIGSGVEKVYPPIEFQIQKLKTKLAWIKNATKADELVIWLSPTSKAFKENFRLGLAKLQPYKGNRLLTPKSPDDPKLHAYLIEHQGAIEAEGQEADDECGIAACKGHLVACIDKDVLYSVPGRKFNYNTGEFTKVSESLAWLDYFKQVLTGDAGDNIPGIYRMGDKTASKLLEMKGKPTPQKLYNRVYEIYKEYFKGEHPKQLANRLHENATLVWIRRKPGDNYSDYVARV